MFISSTIMIVSSVSYLIYFYSTLPSARVRKNVNRQRPTTHHGTSHPPRSGNPKSLASYFMNSFLLAVADAQDPWAYANVLNAGSGVLQPPLATRCQMHAKCIKHGIARTDRAAAASTPVRPATRGHGRMRGGVLFRLAPRWPSESAYRRYASSYIGWYV